MKELYCITIKYTVMVLADNKEKAEELGSWHATDDYNEPDFASVRKVKKLDDIPQIWRDCIPYGGDEDSTCEEIIKEMEG